MGATIVSDIIWRYKCWRHNWALQMFCASHSILRLL